MTGLADIVSSRIAGLRMDEIKASRRHRVLNVLVFISCMLPIDSDVRLDECLALTMFDRLCFDGVGAGMGFHRIHTDRKSPWL